MSLFSSPEEHAANPPQTWVITKTCDRLWALKTASGDTIDAYRTKRQAVAARAGLWQTFYDREGRWYAGETPTGHRSWADCKAERDRIAAR